MVSEGPASVKEIVKISNTSATMITGSTTCKQKRTHTRKHQHHTN